HRNHRPSVDGLLGPRRKHRHPQRERQYRNRSHLNTMSRGATLSASRDGVFRRRPACSSPATEPRSTVMPPPSVINDSSSTRRLDPSSNESCAQAVLKVRTRSSSYRSSLPPARTQSTTPVRKMSTAPLIV